MTYANKSSETRTDENFPNQQFFFCQCFLSRTLTTHRTAREGRGPPFIPLYLLHPLTNIQTFICRNKLCGGLLFYVNENILCKLINNEIFPNDIEMIMFEFLVKTIKLENGFALVFTNHHSKTKIFFLIFYLKTWANKQIIIKMLCWLEIITGPF